MSYDPFDLTAQQADAQASAEDAERARRQDGDDLREVMATLAGRRVMWSVVARVFQTSYVGGEGTAFNEGARNVSLRMISRLRAACPTAYLQMLEENHL